MIGDQFPGLLAAAQAGDEGAFLTLWRDGNPALLRYLRVIAPESAEKAAAQTWVTVAVGLAGFGGGEIAWRAWLFGTARSQAAADGTRRQRSPEPPAAPGAGAGKTGHAVDAGALPGDLATRSALAAVAALPPLQAEVIMLRVVAGLDTETVAQLVGRSPGTVRMAAHRGLARLAERIAAGAGVPR